MYKIDEDILRPLTEAEFQELFDLYKNKYGTKNFHYLLMNNQKKWNEKLHKLNISTTTEDATDEWIAFRKTFYTHRKCDFRKSGTYVSLHMDIMQSVSFHSWESDFKEIYECLRETKLIRWEDGLLLTTVDLQFCEEVKKIAMSKGVLKINARRCCGLILDHDDAMCLKPANLPTGYALRAIHREDIELIHSLWANKFEGSLNFVAKLAEINHNTGIVRLEDDKLVGWIFQNDFVGIGIMMVSPTEQRKGFGQILASTLSKEIAKTEDAHVSAWTIEENFKSQALLTKTGYKHYVIMEWMQLVGKIHTFSQ